MNTDGTGNPIRRGLLTTILRHRHRTRLMDMASAMYEAAAKAFIFHRLAYLRHIAMTTLTTTFFMQFASGGGGR